MNATKCLIRSRENPALLEVDRPFASEYTVSAWLSPTAGSSSAAYDAGAG